MRWLLDYSVTITGVIVVIMGMCYAPSREIAWMIFLVIPAVIIGAIVNTKGK